MNKFLKILILCCIAPFLQAEKTWDFPTLLDQMQLTYSTPTGWNSAKKVYSNIQSNKVLVAPNGQAELHILLRPIDLMNIDYDDPHSSAPDPNEIFPLLFDSIVQRYSNNRNSLKSEYQRDQAAKKFNANWAAASVFGLKEDISSVYSEAALIAIHRHNLGDAYLLILSNGLADIKPLVGSAQESLKFKDASAQTLP